MLHAVPKLLCSMLCLKCSVELGKIDTSILVDKLVLSMFVVCDMEQLMMFGVSVELMNSELG